MELPLFPLHTVLFPGRPLPLHVFEQRYRDMLRDCLASDGRFGVVAIRSGREVGDDAELFDVGTIGEVEQVEQLEDGRANVVIRGVERFRIGRVLTDRSYLRALAEPLAERPLCRRDLNHAQALRNLLVRYLGALGAPRQMLEQLPTAPQRLVWLAASTLQVELPELQRLLEIDDTGQRLAATLQMLRRESSIARHFGTVASLRPAGPGGADLN
ncbi:MAG TPA: LON peptidase substrate-binding domain-containing protein [Egibacteraceae bacterium]|nr:LON peptidase substrate-binding domain-containing protein [Egibacteraceae bacterium]